MKTEVMSFRQDIPPSTTKTITEVVKAKGEVIEVRLRFYPGQERSLQVRPFLKLAELQAEDLFTWGGSNNGTGAPDKFLSGDDDYFVYPVSATVDRVDQVAVWVNNSDPTYTYTLVCDVVVQYFGAD